MNTICKRVIALFLCFVLTVGILPVSAFADEGGETAAAPATASAEPTQADAENTEVPTDLTGTAALSSGAPDISEDDDKDVPSEDDDTNTPSEGNGADTTSEGNDANTPSEGNDANTPSEGNDADTPSEGNDATEPSNGATEPSSEATEPSSEPTEPQVIAVTGIMLDQTALEVGVGELPMTLVATVLPEDATDKTVTWESSEPGVASVENGVLTFGYMGEAVITATAGEFSATCTVTVDEGESTAYADPDTIYVLAGSDFQPLNDDVAAGKELLAGILDIVDNTHSRMDGFLFLGDYSYHGGDTNSTTNVNYATNGLNAVKKTVQNAYSTLGTGTNDMIWVQGNHDYTIPDLSPSGANDTANYGVYVIHENDFPGDDSNAETTVQATADALDSYLDAKVAAGYTKPIFVVSHLPLHFTYRTVSRNDGIYAGKLVDVLNEAGSNGLNIFFLYGHIHSHGYDEYMGGEYVYVPRDGQIAVATSKTTCAYEAIDFTYLNGGYVSYYCDTPGNNSGYDTDDALSMTVFEITGSDVTIHRYNNDSEVNLKNAGAFTSADSTVYGYSVNSTVVGSPQTVRLTTDVGQRVAVTPVTDLTTAFSGFTVESEPVSVEVTSDTEGVTYEWVSTNTNVATVTGNGATATISPVSVGTTTIQVTATPAARAAAYPGTYTFNVTVAAADAVVIPGTQTTTIWRPATDLTAGKTYLLVSDAGNGDGDTRYAVANTSSATVATKTVTVQTDATGDYIETDDQTLMWLAEDATVGSYHHPYLKNSSTGRYLQYQNANTLRTTSSNTNEYIKWRIGGNYDGLYVVRSDSSDSQYRRYMRYSATNGTLVMETSATDAREITAWILSESQSGSGDLTVSISSLYGTVKQNAGATASTGATLNIQDADGNTKTVNVTLGMLRDASGNAVSTAVVGTQTGLSVYYMDTLITSDFTLRVRERSNNDNPEYPDPGAVSVDKTTDEAYLQQTGVAKVELSTSGIPVDKGVDVLVVVDTSSSMNNNGRIDALRDALGDMLLAFNKEDGQGNVPDIQIAIMDFNGYYNDNDLKYREGTELSTVGNYWDRDDAAKVYTGTYKNESSVDAWGNGAAAFVQNTEFVNAKGTLDTSEFNPEDVTVSGGTAYDLGLSRAYNMLSSKQAQNAANGEERDSFVIFMSDGAPYGYNGIVTKTEYEIWNDYLLGTYPTLQALEDAVKAKITAAGGDSNAFEIAALDHEYGYLYNGQGTGNGVNTDASGAALHPHRWAEAIKGDTEQQYAVIGSDYQSTTKPGLGATMFTIGFQLADDRSGDYVATTGKSGTTYKATMEAVLKAIASYDLSQLNTRHYYSAEDAASLSAAFTDIADNIAYAATNAYFLDQMGDSVSLQMTSTVNKRDESGEIVATPLSQLAGNITPMIRVLNYKIYLSSDVGKTINGQLVTTSMVGERYGDPIEVEVVTFTDDGNGNLTGAYSSLLGENVNILKDGVIEAKNFWYNTAITTRTITLTDGSTYPLEKETFYWNIGTINELEWALEYYVYLDGSMEGYTDGGSYNTNKYATLHYTNWLGNDAYKDTTSPQLGWLSANVSFGFYLVNENGDPIVNQTTGQTGSFYDAIKVTRPVLFQEIMLNNLDEIDTIEAKSLDVLPDEYALYDESASYKVVILSEDGKGSWTITKGSDKIQSTYVTGYRSTNASNEQLVTSNADVSGPNYTEHTDYDYTHTTVWFAVLWRVQALPDSVVVDYGLPVDISVLSNDMFGEYGKLDSIGAYTDTLNLDGHDTTPADGFDSEYTGTYGTAKADTSTGKVRYTLNTMEMPTYEKFAYAVNYTGSENPGYYYDTITVIPATTIYYEDSFLTFAGNNSAGQTTGVASTVPTTGPVSGQWYLEGDAQYAIQDEDRPGKYSLTDANNIYGYDNVNKGMSTFSLGSAAKVHVDANSYATAEFTFMGTGFDVISMTSCDTGLLKVQVWEANADGTNGTQKRNTMVNTYYGYTSEDHYIKYTYDGDMWTEEDLGTSVQNVSEKPDNPTQGDTYIANKQVWVVNPEADSALYQIPVIKIEDLDYKKYNVKITAAYNKLMDVANQGAYDLYLDAIRIYDPANDGKQDGDAVIEDAYKADGEGWPSYVELRNGLISEETLGNAATDTKVEGLVFIDGDESVGDAQISDYISYGPNNEVYLAPGQRVAFRLDLPANAANVHIGIKSADGNIGTYTITNIAQEADTENNVAAGQWYNARTASMDTATDMYYDLTEWKDDIIVISNTGNREEHNTSGIISLTNIKFTYTSDPDGNEAGIFVTPKMAMLTLRSLNAPVEEEVPEETVPEETVPETTAPETTEPEEMEPEETEPEETQPDKEAAKIQKEIEKALKKAAKEAEKAAKALQKAAEKAAKALSKLFGSWF